MSDDASKSHGADSKDVNNHTRETKNFSLPWFFCLKIVTLIW
jgi:hypothetical protein